MDDVTPTQLSAQKTEVIGLIGPMEAAWKQTFVEGFSTLSPLLVIVWHSEWVRSDHKLWVKLYQKLTSIHEKTRILVLIFSETPDDVGEEEQGHPLTFFLRSLAADRLPDPGNRERPVGWASISDVARFQSAAVEWQPCSEPSESALLRLCMVCAELSEWPGGSGSKLPSLTLTQFFQFLSDPIRFRASILHGAAKPQSERQRLNGLKWLAARALIPRSLPLKVLIVENDPNEPKKSAEKAAKRFKSLSEVSACPLGYLSKSEFYLVSEGFERLKTESARQTIRATKYVDGWTKQNAPEEIPWSELDLVLQDVMLGSTSARVSGLELASFYFDACPQALVFLLTRLDIESLVVSGDVNWKFVDAVIPKDGIESLWFEYSRCFRERFGRMFWPDWITGDNPDRKLLRHLYGSLRKWQVEPDILWHGQTLPEMIDHAHRHITALWRLVNDFVGTLIENGGADDSILDRRHRVALALAVWMHDVGHRGDQYIAGSMEIRKSHAGISEGLLLRNPDAYSLGWLLKPDWLPHSACSEPGDNNGTKERMNCRIDDKCRGQDKSLCLLREVGLLCRHHQSNAPLDEHSVRWMAQNDKNPAVYTLVPDPHLEGVDNHVFLRSLTDHTRPVCPPGTLPPGTRMRLLSEYSLRDNEGTRCIAGLLRMLDALQVHRARVGSKASIASFCEFLDNRVQWCNSERERLAPNPAPHANTERANPDQRRHLPELCAESAHPGASSIPLRYL